MNVKRTYSLVTAVYDGGQAYLREAYESVLAQRDQLPGGWDVQWVVQEDGMTGAPARELPAEPWISTGMAQRGGAAVARTTALTRVRGELVRALDADDLLTPAALARDIEALDGHPEMDWCISAGLDLLPNGEARTGPYDPPEGPLDYEYLLDAYDQDRFPVLGTHLAVRAPLLYALGGWPALTAWETIAIVLRCAAVGDGWMIAAPGGYYRKHPAQTTAHPQYEQRVDVKALRTLVRRLAEGVRHTDLRWSAP